LVLYQRETLGFSLEAGHPVLLERGRALERLDRHRASERVLDCAVNYRHSSRSYLLDDAAVAYALEHGTQRSVTGLTGQDQRVPGDLALLTSAENVFEIRFLTR